MAEMLTEDQRRNLRSTLCSSMTDAEFETFVMTCERTQLDPFARQIFPVGRWDSKANKTIFQTQVSIDGFRLIAERTKHYAGQLGPFWCGPDGEWKEVWLKDTPPFAAMVKVIRHDFKEPLTSVARFADYVQTTKAKDGQPAQPNAMWKKLGVLMIAKCAEALALRRAFPQELSGLYTEEELYQAEEKQPDPPPPPTQQKPPANPPPAQKKADPPPPVPLSEDQVNALLVKVDGCPNIPALNGLWAALNEAERSAVRDAMNLKKTEFKNAAQAA
jgi:phage recombination protein Bet